jgi:hypothetical protein
MSATRFRNHFAVYFALCAGLGFARILQGQMRWEAAHIAAILVCSIPLAAIAAWFAVRQPTHVEGQLKQKTRVIKAALVALALCGAALAAASLLR